MQQRRMSGGSTIQTSTPAQSGPVSRVCLHDLNPAHCEPCRVAKAARRQPSELSATGRKFLALLNRQHRVRNGSTAQRKAIGLEVKSAAGKLGTQQVRLARKMLAQHLSELERRRKQRHDEDRLADVTIRWVTPQNVGRGRRS